MAIYTVRNTLPKEEHAEVRDQIAAMLPEICSSISKHVLSIRSIVASHDPLDLLRRAFFESVQNRIGLTKESDLAESHVIDLRMQDYLQSVIVATPITDAAPSISNELWNKLRGHVSELFSTLNHQYFSSRSAAAAKSESYDSTRDKLFTWVMMHRCNVRGTRYVEHERDHLQDLIGPHSAEIKKLYGISAAEFIDGIIAIVEKHLYGVFSSLKEVKRLHAEWASQVDENSLAEAAASVGLEKAIRDSVNDLGLAEELNANMEIAFGFGLFDVALITHFPDELISDLSMSPGDDISLFDASDQSGWPTKYRNTLDRPFLKVGGRSYCFDIYTLLDGLYRAVGRIVRAKDPEYGEEWNRVQKTVSESIPTKLLSHIMPGSVYHLGSYYQYRNSETNKLDWAEVDGIVLFDDIAIVVEVKAGAFLPFPPTPDMEEFLASVQDILQTPANQGNRIAEMIRSGETVALFAEQGKKARMSPPLLEIDGKAVRKCYVAAVSLDQLTEIASTIQHHLPHQPNEESPVWRISIDDLRIYADMFTNPLIFCHYLEERHRAFSCDLIDSVDEMDHFGLYMSTNCYAVQAEQARGQVARIMYNGFRDSIEEFYHKKHAGENVVPPRQDAPEFLYKVLDALHAQTSLGRCAIASRLLGMDGESREYLWSEVESIIPRVISEGKAPPLSANGVDPVTVLVELNSARPLEDDLYRDHVMACMLLAEDSSRLMMRIVINSAGDIDFVGGEILVRDCIDEEKEATLHDRLLRLRRNRLRKARCEVLGRNDPCPCGSGRKYKKCCIDRD